MNIFPAWNDERIVLSSDPNVGSMYFRVLIDNNSSTAFTGDEQTIFEGLAIRRPGEALDVAVNDVVADYFNTSIDAYNIDMLSNDWLANGGRLNIAVRVDTSEDRDTWTTGTPFALVPDWSYVPRTIPDPGWQSAPIRATFEPGFYLIGTIYGAEGAQLEAKILEGGLHGSFNRSFSSAFSRALTHTVTIGTALNEANVDAFALLTGEDVEPGDVVYLKSDSGDKGPEYVVLPSCSRYALYYRNAFGGIDFMLVKGPVTRTEGYVRNTAGRHIDKALRGLAYQRGVVSYRNDVTVRWTLPLGTLTDDEASRVWHLSGSTEVWLYDRVADYWTPVRITDAENIDKTFRNQGRKRVEYTITAETAQERLRR